MRYGDGVGDFDTTVHRPRSATAKWDPPVLAPGVAASQQVSLPRAAIGDLATATHTGIVGNELVQLTAIAVNGGVACVLRNAGTTPLDIRPGTLRVSTTAFESSDDSAELLHRPKLKTDEAYPRVQTSADGRRPPPGGGGQTWWPHRLATLRFREDRPQ